MGQDSEPNFSVPRQVLPVKTLVTIAIVFALVGFALLLILPMIASLALTSFARSKLRG